MRDYIFGKNKDHLNDYKIIKSRLKEIEKFEIEECEIRKKLRKLKESNNLPTDDDEILRILNNLL